MGPGTCISLDTADGDDGPQSVRVKTKIEKGEKEEGNVGTKKGRTYRCQMENPQPDPRCLRRCQRENRLLGQVCALERRCRRYTSHSTDRPSGAPFPSPGKPELEVDVDILDGSHASSFHVAAFPG